MHSAFGGGFVQLLGYEPELLAGRFDVPFAQGRLEMLDLRFDLALPRPVDRPSLDVLSCSFFRL